MPGFRITARSLVSQGLSEEVLKEFSDLETCAALEPGELTIAGEKVVFVLEDEDVGRDAAIARRA